MTTRQIPVYATTTDWKSLLREVAERRPVQYVCAGLFDAPIASVFAYPFGDENQKEQSNSPPVGTSLLVFDAGEEVSFRTVPQRRGGQKYALDQLANGQTIVLNLGQATGECLVAGQIGTSSDDLSSLELLGVFEDVLASSFKKVRSYMVGPHATELWQNGWRLTANPRSPTDFDLKAPEKTGKKTLPEKGDGGN